MSDDQTVEKVADTDNEDSTADAIAAVALILIAVLAMVYWVAGQ